MKIKDYEFDAGVVPEIFFDVIARIVPGTTILFVFWLNQIINPDQLEESVSKIIPSEISAFQVLSIIFGGYLIGLLLHQLWFLLSPIIQFIKSIWPFGSSGSTVPELTNQEIYILRKNHPFLAPTLLKFQAEITLSEVMVTGMTLIIFISILDGIFSFLPASLNFFTAPTWGFAIAYGVITVLCLILRNNLEGLSIASRDELKKQSIICIDISRYWPHGMTVNQVWNDNSSYPHGTLTQDQLSQAMTDELLIANLDTNHLDSLINFARIQDSSVNYQNILKLL
ncbi:MAG: hypothetical protein WBM44_22690 [Waterburya sp.]